MDKGGFDSRPVQLLLTRGEGRLNARGYVTMPNILTATFRELIKFAGFAGHDELVTFCGVDLDTHELRAIVRSMAMGVAR